jgi:hypothetical protein
MVLSFSLLANPDPSGPSVASTLETPPRIKISP